MRGIRNWFRDASGQVKWGYKFASLILIWEVFMPVFMLFAAVGLNGIAFFLFGVAGFLGDNGELLPEYLDSANRGWFILMMCIQNTGLILLCCGAWRVFFKRPLGQMGLRLGDGGERQARESGKKGGSPLSGLLLGFGAGALMISLVCGLIYLTGGAKILWDEGLNLDGWLILYFVMFVFVGFGEEISFRGYGMGSLRQTGSPWLLCGLTALVFGVAHSANANFTLMGCLNICLIGVFLALWVLRSGTIWPAAGFHIAWNYFQGCVFGFDVSGLEVKGLLTTAVSSPSLKNGGKFGPEGSLAATAVTLAAIGLFLWDMRRKGDGGRFLEE